MGYKIGDLGMVHWASSKTITDNIFTNAQGTPKFLPPERIDHTIAPDEPVTKVDIYTLGYSNYISATNDHMFISFDKMNLDQLNPQNRRYIKIKHCSEEFNQCVQSMMGFYPQNRPTAKIILEHPLINVKAVKKILHNVLYNPAPIQYKQLRYFRYALIF